MGPLSGSAKQGHQGQKPGMPLDLIGCEHFALISKKGDLMPNLFTQDVHTYITELLSEMLGPEETPGASSQSRLPADPAVKRKAIETDLYHKPNKVHSNPVGG